MKTKGRKMPALIDSGLACAQREQAHQQLWLAVAQAAQRGWARCPEAPTLDAVLYNLTCRCAAAGIGVDDDLRASIALSEAGVEARGRWRKDGFAYGIKRKVGRLTVHVPGKGPVEFADWLARTSKVFIRPSMSEGKGKAMTSQTGWFIVGFIVGWLGGLEAACAPSK